MMKYSNKQGGFIEIVVVLAIGIVAAIGIAAMVDKLPPLVEEKIDQNVGSGGRVQTAAIGISSLGGLTGSTQTFGNDTNVTITSSGTTHTVGWSGTAAISRGGTATSTQVSNGVNYYDGTKITSDTKFTFDGSKLGIASSTPWSKLSLGNDQTTGSTASSTITVAEYRYGGVGGIATSTAATIDARTSNVQHWPIGTAATTLTLSGFVPGQSLKFIVENPNATAGAITWAVASGYQLYWAGGTTPTQTTTANKHDIWVFTATKASSTVAILGALSANY